MSDVYVPVGDDSSPTDGLGTPDAEAGVDHGDMPQQRPPAPREPPEGGGSSLGRYLTRRGFRVVDHPARGRTTTWDRVRWIFVHHTGGRCDPEDERHEAHYIKTAEGRFPPLAQLMLGQSLRIWVLCEQHSGQNEPGRASHAGAGALPGIPRDCANQVALGIEVQCSGKHPLQDHRDQYATLIELVAALCERYGLGSRRVVGHKEWSSIGKVDPRDSMDDVRRDVAGALRDRSATLSSPIPTAPSTSAPSGDPTIPFVAAFRQQRKVYRSKMRAGQVDSDSVWNIQNALLAIGFSIASGPTDEYTPEAVAACRLFQEAQGWTGTDADGIAGPMTVKRLGLVWVEG